MNIKNLIKKYDSLIDVDKSLEKEVQTQVMFKQLKTYRNALCSKTKSINDILKIEYAYIISSLNNRHKIWAYDYMTFPRRIGETWESLCKGPFHNANIRLFQPNLQKLKDDLNLPMQLWDIIGDVNLRQDFHFYLKKSPHVIDFKSSFNSNEKGNVQRLKTIGALYKLWKPDSKLYILMRQGRENNPYLMHLEPNWTVLCGNDAYAEIKRVTHVDLQGWIKKHVRFKEHLDRSFYKHLEKESLVKYLSW